MSGMVFCETSEYSASVAVEATGLGLMAVHDPIDRSVTFGWARRTYLFAKAEPGDREDEAVNARRWGYCAWPALHGAPLLADTRIFGLNIRTGPPDIGVSIGYEGRTNRVPVKADETMAISTVYKRGYTDKSVARICKGALCGELY